MKNITNLKNYYLISFFIAFAVVIFQTSCFESELTKADTVQVNCSGTSGSPYDVDEASLAGDDVTFADTGGDGYCLVDTDINANSVIVGSGVVIIHSVANTNGVDITTTTDFNLQSGSSINVTGKGYASGVGTGAGTGGYRGSGGGYGGNGGDGLYGADGGITYGDPKSPSALGSGGVNYGTGGNGGGIIKLTAGGTLTVAGSLIANGNPPPGDSGAGSGGSIWIDADVLTGSGSITANGGSAGHWSQSCGGGGRIALYYNSDSSSLSALTSYGGSHDKPAGAGTIFKDDKDDSNSYGTLIVDNNNVNGDYTTQSTTSSQRFDSIIIRNGGDYVIPSGFTLSIQSGGTLTGGGTTKPSITINSGGEFETSSATFTFANIDIINNGNVDVVNTLTIDNGTFTHNGGFNAVGEVSTLNFANAGKFILNGSGFAATSLTINNSGTFIYQSGALPLTTLTVANTGTFEQRKTGAVSIATVTVQSGGTITHTANSAIPKTYELNLSSTNIDVLSGGFVNVNGKGYSAGNGTGSGAYVNNYGGIGAGYGGRGGYDSYGQAPGITYGSVTQPTDPGSGGGSGWGGSGTNGGGVIKLTASGTLTVAGTISANGATSGAECGGGSGGSIWLDTDTLSGGGTITVNGGYGGGRGSAGGSGRIAIKYNTDSSTLISGNKFQTYGGNLGGRYGGGGTTFVDDKNDSLTNGNLYVDNNNQAGTTTTQVSELSSSSQYYDNITIRNGANYLIPSGFFFGLADRATGTLNGGGSTRPTVTIDGGIFYPPHSSGVYTLSNMNIIMQNNGSLAEWTNLTLSNANFTHISGSFGSNLQQLTIGTGSTFSAGTTNTLQLSSLLVQNGGIFEQRKTGAINIPTVTVQSGGTLSHAANSSSKAYELYLTSENINIQSGGFINVNGKGFSGNNGTGHGSGDYRGSGAGYGGVGAAGLYSQPGGTTYGSATQPTDLGSGGGGSGGGAIRLVVSNTLTVSGTVSSNGNGPSGEDGAGSGGSVWLDTVNLAGNGTVTANGGNQGGWSSAAGGGGRISITYNLNSSNLTKQANRGTGDRLGGNGTINFIQKKPTATNFGTAYGTTNFDLISDFTAISNMKLATQHGLVQWNGATVNAEGQDYDSNVRVGQGFVSLNPSSVHNTLTNNAGGVSGFNARVSLYVDGCSTYTIYYATGFRSSLDDIKNNGQACNETTNPACTNITCSGGLLSFDVPHFDGYGGEGVSSSEGIGTSVNINNSSSVITATPSDGGSNASSPTNVGNNVTFTSTAKDINGEQYFLAICKTDAVTSGGSSAPVCDDGAWAISSATNSDSQATVTYTALSGDVQSNDWYAFVCDKVTGGACFPASGNGDQGSALGSITMSLSGTPSDGDYITVDGVLYEFNLAGGDCTGGPAEDVCVTLTERGGQEAAYQLVQAEAGPNTYMTDRANVVYIYANNPGAGGNEIGITINSCSVCTASGSALTGGSDASSSPFKVNHAGTFGTVGVTDTNGDTIEPGDTLSFRLPNAQIDDQDSDGTQDTMTMYICTEATTGFNYSTDSCTDGSLICSSSAVNPTTSDATCTGGASLISVPTAHGSYGFKVYAKDNHNFPATGTNAQNYTVTDVPPILVSYSASDAPGPSAGSSDTVDFSATMQDDNGDNDVTAVEGVFYDDAAINLSLGTCSASENNCYLAAVCTPGGVSTPGTGKTASGTDNELTASCSVTVWFNANGSAQWKAHINPTDGTGKVTSFADSDALTNPALSGIDVVEPGIVYGTIVIGGTSSGQETSMGNVGNQALDVYVSGTNMTSGGNSIPASQQKWHHTSSSFDWDTGSSGPGPYSLVVTPSGTGDSGGCLNRNILVRSVHGTADTNESIFWKLRIPTGQEAGSYTGQNTFATTAEETCITGEPF